MDQRRAPSAISVIAFINNDISAKLLKSDLDARGIGLENVALILGRNLDREWFSQCGILLRYGAVASLSVMGQRHVAGFYRKAAKLVRQVVAAGALRHIHVVNNDNLICSHLISLASRSAEVDLSVVCEGLMNYQDITVANRAAWRWRVKPVLSTLLGLRYRQPVGHLSGAYDNAVTRVVAFARPGLKAPPEKVVVYPFELLEEAQPGSADVALIAHCALWQWMAEDKYRPFAEAFADWVRKQGFTKIYAKPHPRYATGYLEDLLPEHEILQSEKSLEDLAGGLEMGVIIGTCTTALVTLKLLRPSLLCIDYGGDYYTEHAYHGDTSILELFRSLGIKTIPFGGDGMN